jgi:putative spermidine/putrescine transport system ATP-binding protein
MFLGIEAVSKAYQGKTVLDCVSLEVEEGELVSIIGPSGSGKTTLLKLIAGLEVPDQGRISSRADLRRDPAILVFQDYLLFPTMSVFDNIAFGLRARHIKRREVADRVAEMLSYFGLSELARQYPRNLSSGQQQRVALARAMVVGPAVLLLDEPFANLDRNLKATTAEFIRCFQKEYKITTLCVTHDLQEAMMMSDKVGVLLEGVLRRYDRPAEVYGHPGSVAVAAFLGAVNIVPIRSYAGLGIDIQAAEGAEVVAVRAEAISVEKDPQGAGVVEDLLFAGRSSQCRITIDGVTLTAYIDDHMLGIGDRVRVTIKSFMRLEGEGQ